MSFQKTNIDVSITIWNEKSKQWEKAELNSGEAQQILSALDLIKENGQVAEALKKEGTVLEITGKRVLSKEAEGQYVDLTPDTGWFSRDIHKQIRTQLTSVVRTVKQLSQSRIRSTGDVAIDQEKAKKEGGVVIEVRVGAQSQSQFNIGYEAEYKHFEVIEKAVRALDEEDWKSHIPEPYYQKIKDKLENVYQAQREITNILNRVDELLKQNQIQEAVKYYREHMPQAFGKYCEALREWEPERNFLIELFGNNAEENPFLFVQTALGSGGMTATQFVRSPETQLHIARYLFSLEKGISEKEMDEISEMKWLQFHLANLENTKPFGQFCQNQIGKLLKEENIFLQEVDNAINKLQDLDVRKELLKRGFTEEDIDHHLEKLSNLASQLKIMNQNLANVHRLFELGNLKEGVELYSNLVQVELPKYQKALSELVVPQRVAANRFRDFAPFNLKLSRIEIHQRFCQALKEKQEALNLTKNNGEEDLYSFDASLETLKAESELLQETSKFAQLSSHLNDWQKRGENFLTNLKLFVDSFKEKREEFEEWMRKEGFTDLQTAAFFNHYETAYTAFSAFYSALQEATDLANKKDYASALQKVCDVLIEKFPKVNEAIAQGLLYAEQIQKDPRLDRVLKEFFGKGSARIKAALEFQRLAGVFNAELLGFNKDIEKGQFGVPEDYQKASNLIAQKLRNNNRFIDRERRLSNQNYGFINFFNFSFIGKDPILAPLWNQILKNEKWTFKEAEAFTRLYNDYAALIEPLQEGERAIAQEQDPIKKRALKAQLTRLASQLAPKIGKLGEQFKKLGGYERLESLSRAASQLAGKMQSNEIKEKIGELFESNKVGYERLEQQMPFTSIEDLVNNIESISQLPRSNQEQKIFIQTWGEALALVKRYKIIEGIQSEAASFQQLMNDRRSYIRDFGIRHHLFIPWEDKAIGRTLLSGPQTQDKIYGQKMMAKGWSPKKVIKLSHWYDAFNKAVHPVQLAYARLAEDPENVLLQQALRNTYENQKDTINKLADQMNKDKDIGGIQDIKKLENGVKDYKFHVLNQILEVQKSIETASGESSKELLEAKLKELHSIISELDKVDFAETIERQNDFLINVSKMLRNKMSWEKSSFWKKSYLNELTDPHSPLAAELKNNLQESITVSDVKSIQKLYESYRSELEKINELERKLEREPSNRSVLKQLRRELEERADGLNKLDKKLIALQGKIDLLQNGVDLIKDKWEKVLRGFERIRVLQQSEGQEALIEIEQRAIGDRTVEQAQAMIDQCNRMNIKKAMGEKIRFKQDVYRRHVNESGQWRT